jgi:hypothetical protein
MPQESSRNKTSEREGKRVRNQKGLEGRPMTEITQGQIKLKESENKRKYK